jgi:hypothetical protein
MTKAKGGASPLGLSPPSIVCYQGTIFPVEPSDTDYHHALRVPRSQLHSHPHNRIAAYVKCVPRFCEFEKLNTLGIVGVLEDAVAHLVLAGDGLLCWRGWCWRWRVRRWRWLRRRAG